MSRLWFLVVAVFGAAAGVLSANVLIERLAITMNTEREFMISHVSQSLQIQTPETAALQNATYEQRIQSLDQRIANVEAQTASIELYLEPLETEYQQYRELFNEKAEASQSERLDLYIELVNTYRDYQRINQTLNTFVPLNKSDSLLSDPSVPLDLVHRLGGNVANTHNQFIDEARDARFAQSYEQPLRTFLSNYALNSTLVECHMTLCAVHLTHQWSEPYYQGFDKIWEELSSQSWMFLTRVEHAHEYRGNGRQVAVWYLEETS